MGIWEIFHIALAVLFVVASWFVWHGVKLEESSDRFDKERGKDLLLRALVWEVVLGIALILVDTVASYQQRSEIIALRRAAAWRSVTPEQEAILRKEISGHTAQGHAMALYAFDPEETQYFFSIASACGKIPGCNGPTFHFVNPNSPFPFAFPPTGVMWFENDNAPDDQKLFVKAFRDAGIATQQLGTLPASQLFQPNVRAGIVIAPKPDANAPYPYSSQSLPPPQ